MVIETATKGPLSLTEAPEDVDREFKRCLNICDDAQKVIATTKKGKHFP